MVNLTTSDDVEFKVDREVVERSVLIKNMLEGSFLLFVAMGVASCFILIHPVFIPDVGESEQAIPLPNVSSSVMKKVRVFSCLSMFVKSESWG
jgi:S-phase kinase-associated protein 1